MDCTLHHPRPPPHLCYPCSLFICHDHLADWSYSRWSLLGHQTEHEEDNRMMVDVLLLMGRVDSDLAPVQTGIGPPGVWQIFARPAIIEASDKLPQHLRIQISRLMSDKASSDNFNLENCPSSSSQRIILLSLPQHLVNYPFYGPAFSL